MNNDKILLNLQDFGLSQAEAKTYITLLSLEYAKISDIAKKAENKRTTTYDIINSLISKGIVVEIERGFKKFYKAESPSKLKILLEKRKDNLLEILPVLENLYINKEDNSIVRIYEGLESLKIIADEILESISLKDDYFVIGDAERWDLFDKDFFKKFNEKRIKLNVKANILLTNSEQAKESKKFERNFNEEIKIMPDDYKIDVNALILKNKVVIYSLLQPIRILVIENRPTVHLLHTLFSFLWKSIV